jgi:glycosyltransferase involved in cell wall biosynthesis
MKILHVTHSRDAVGDTAKYIERLDAGLKALGEISVVADEKSQIPNEDWDIIHIHGLWKSFYHLATIFARENSIPIVRSVYGETSHWNMKQGWLWKFIAWNFHQKKDLNKASLIHAISDDEVENMRNLDVDCRFKVISFGADLPDLSKETLYTKKEKIFLFAASAHPVNGLEELLHTWKICEHGNWRLRIVATDGERYLSKYKKIVKLLKLVDVEFAVCKSSQDLEIEYAKCDCFVYPSFNEYDGATVVNALAYGKPCIASKFTPWRILPLKKCGWWSVNRPKALSEAMQEVIALDDENLKAYGENARALAEKHFTWSNIAEKMQTAYADVLTHRRHEKKYSWQL